MCSAALLRNPDPQPINQRPTEKLQSIGMPEAPKPRTQTLAQRQGRSLGMDTRSGMEVFEQRAYEAQLNEYNSAQAEIKRRQDLTDQLAAQAAERKAVIQAQQQQMVDMQKQQEENVKQQQAQSAGLQAQQVAQDLKIGQMQDSASTVANSMRILGQAPGSKAPTATMTKRGNARGTAATATAGKLRIGTTARTPGVGTNLGV